MADSRRRARSTSDDEHDPIDRSVTPRRSLLAEDSDLDEEPYEDEEESHPIPSSSPPPVPTPAASPSTNSPPVPSSPIIPSSPIPTPRQAGVLRWDWMPKVLDWWRRDEQIPILPEVPGPRTPIPPFTQEPVHHTVPVLITRLLSHERILERLEQKVYDRMDIPTNEVEHLQHQVSGVENDLTELRDTVVTTHEEGIDTRDEVATLCLRVERGENCISELEEWVTAMDQEIIALRADRDQLRTVVASSVRLVERLEGLCERLR